MTKGKTSPLIEERNNKAQRLLADGVNLYPTGYPVDITSFEAIERFGNIDAEVLEKDNRSFSMAGRIIARRDFGKASFIHLKDRNNTIIRKLVRK